MALALPLLAACGGGGGDGDDNPAPETPASTATISGRLVAPDSQTPIANALVYVEDSAAAAQAAGAGREPAAAAAELACGAPPNAAWVATCTDANGNFSLKAAVPAAPTLVVVKGAFRQETEVALTASGTIELGAVVLKAAETGARLAVVTGSYDRIQDVLAKLGYGELEGGRLKLSTEKFALYDGDSTLPDTYKPMDALFEDGDKDGKADIYKYGVVFFNCGLEESVLGDATKLATLKAYVEAGGRLYASDLAYDFVEQSFPAFVNFEGSDEIASTAPENLDAAELGESGISVEASVDPALAAWLGNVTCGSPAGSCLTAGGKVHIEGFLSGWAVITGAHQEQQSQVRTWASGAVTFGGQSQPVVRPLTVTFPVGKGRVTYTSYHTEPDAGEAGMLPQERILQFIVFEL
ncbi:hypothetical protein [Caldimonas brevitalea]|uniref:hypothetical protein n=1 Tax=Caldimonas brevitalea TaxID=413882 RepID=UPI0012F95991|nr:hypothetical protein [Caldimonas brevitalea]